MCYSAAIVDLIMEGESGVSVVTACRERGIPVVIVTGLDDGSVSRICDTGDIPVLTKPCDLDDLEQVLLGCIRSPGNI